MAQAGADVVAEVGLRLVGEASSDAGGGTRLRLLVKEFLECWGQRGMARGAVVVLLPDGWERDDPTLLRAQMRRLQRLAHRVARSKTRKGVPGFAPVAAGMAAALPHVEAFIEGHSLRSYARLAAVVLGRSNGGLLGA